MIFNKIARKIKRVLGFDLSRVILSVDSKISKTKSTKIENCNIFLSNNAQLILAENVTIKNCNLWIDNSIVTIQNGSLIQNTYFNCNNNSLIELKSNVEISDYEINLDTANLNINNDCRFMIGRNALKPQISITNGKLSFDSHNVIKADFLVRFGGSCTIGNYNCINERTELRCDEEIVIGNFNMISYECNIWDTNTHCIYPFEKRREITVRDFPYIGSETEKPTTKPISIGNDTWIGKRAVILKGSNIEDGGIVGTNALISNKKIKNNSIAIGNPVINFERN